MPVVRVRFVSKLQLIQHTCFKLLQLPFEIFGGSRDVRSGVVQLLNAALRCHPLGRRLNPEPSRA